MKKTKTLICLLALTLPFALQAEDKDKPEGGGKGGDRKAEMLKKFDTDGDGKLSEEERAELKKAMAGKGRKGKGSPEMKKKLLEKFDSDGDGKLSETERAAAREEMEARRKKAIEEFDKDGDGKLNEEERAAAREAFKQRRGDDGKKDA